MSVIGILSSNLFSGATNGFTGAQNAARRFGRIREEFQQLGQDLQSGNVAQAQADYARLSSEFPGVNPAGTTTTGTGTAATAGASTGAGATTIAQQFTQLGQDLQSGNLQAAQQDYTNLQQAVQRTGTQQPEGHHRAHHHEHGDWQSASSTSAFSQQASSIVRAFSTLAQDLQAGNLSGAQSAFATLQSDLQQIGGFATSGNSSASPASTVAGSSTSSNLNVSA